MANTIKIGNLDISYFKVGGSDCSIYLGTTLLYPTTPPIYQGFCKLTLSDDTVVEIQGSGELTSAMAQQHSATCVSAEIGTLCTSIGNEVFYQFTSLTSVNIPDSVTSIGNFAFGGCRNLTSIDIPNSVTSIGSSAFDNCRSLTSIDIPNSVTSIGGSAFRYCSSITSVTIPDTVTSIGSNTFDGCASLSSIDIPNSVTSISGWAFQNCSSLTSCTIGSGVTSIGTYAFRFCESLINIRSYAMTAPTITYQTFYRVKTSGTLTVPSGSSGYDVWMGTGDYYLGKYNWTKV